VQAAVLLLALAVLYASRRRYWPPSQAGVTAVVAAVALVFVAVAILASWGAWLVAPLPDHVRGSIAGGDGAALRVALLDYRRQPIHLGSGSVASDGRFGLRYESGFGVWPRYLRVSDAACPEGHRDYDISAAQVRRQQKLQIVHRCADG